MVLGNYRPSHLSPQCHKLIFVIYRPSPTVEPKVVACKLNFPSHRGKVQEEQYEEFEDMRMKTQEEFGYAN